MKPEDIFERIGDADERFVADAKKKRQRRWIPVGAVAAVLVLAILVGAFLQPWTPVSVPGGETTGNYLPPLLRGDETTGRYIPLPVVPSLIYDERFLDSYSLVRAEYPLMAEYPSDMKDYNAQNKWYASRNEQKKAYRALENKPTDFFYTVMQTFLKDAENENIICSPVNIYIALAMLAETAEGESRQEILDALGEESIESLRQTANAVWNAHYCDDGAYTSILAVSLWLDDSLSYSEDAIERLAEFYYASAYRGEMGADEYNEALRAWLNIQTGGMLSEQIEDLELSEGTVLALATTVWFRAKWENAFDADENTDAIFHGTNGDILCEFMNLDVIETYYYGERFSAVKMPFDAGGSMYMLLPEEGVDVTELLADAEVIDMLSAPSDYENQKCCNIALSIPKFDVSSRLDLISGLASMGITSVFDEVKADFSAITEQDGISVSAVRHDARVAIDEEGCVAAAFTMIPIDGGILFPKDNISFTVDRPFVFVITSEVGTPLFVGVVNTMQ